jgi:hypothetical protein
VGDYGDEETRRVVGIEGCSEKTAEKKVKAKSMCAKGIKRPNRIPQPEWWS